MKKVMFAGLAMAGAVPAVAHMHGGKGMMNADEPVTLASVEKRVRDEFARLDTNKDGFVAREEADAERERRMAEMRDRHFATLDANKDGSISRAEFDAAHGARKGAGGEGAGMRHHMKGHGRMIGMGGGLRFYNSDADKDGRVSLAEALARPVERFKAMDANKDGTVTPDERKAARDKRRAEWQGKRS